jgi:hypothetical protein
LQQQTPTSEQQSSVSSSNNNSSSNQPPQNNEMLKSQASAFVSNGSGLGSASTGFISCIISVARASFFNFPPNPTP